MGTRGLRDQLLYLSVDCVVNNALLVKAYKRYAARSLGAWMFTTNEEETQKWQM